MTALWIFVGGGLGSVARYALALLAPQPWATLAVNVAGSFALAALVHPAAGVGEAWRTSLGVGLLGGFTTYSAFNLQLYVALREGRTAEALLLLSLTVLGCLAGSALGWSTATVWRR